jgi:ElaB/YqjD/DUF883 family membrane-anchored ribosome-binding protein
MNVDDSMDQIRQSLEGLQELLRSLEEERNREVKTLKKKIEEVKEKYDRDIQSVENSISLLRGKLQREHSAEDAAGYPSEGTIADKILHALGEIGRFAEKDAVVDYILQRESDIRAASIRETASRLVPDGKLARVLNGSRYFGLADWVEEAENGARKISPGREPGGDFDESEYRIQVD